MINNTTEFITDDSSVNYAELFLKLHKDHDIDSVVKAISKLQDIALAIQNKSTTYINNQDPRLSDDRNPVSHIHDVSDIQGLDYYERQEVNSLIDSIYRQIDDTSKILESKLYFDPSVLKGELLNNITSLRKEVYSLVDGIKPEVINNNTTQFTINDSKVKQLESRIKSLSSLLDQVIDKNEEELKELQEEILQSLESKFKKDGQVVNIVGGVNVGQKLKFLKDVNTDGAEDGNALVYDSALEKWVPGDNIGLGAATFSYNGDGTISSITTSDKTISLTYNSSELINTISDGTDTFTYTYNSEDQVTSIA